MQTLNNTTAKTLQERNMQVIGYLDDIGELPKTAQRFHLLGEWSQVFDVATAVRLQYQAKPNRHRRNMHLRPSHACTGLLFSLAACPNHKL